MDRPGASGPQREEVGSHRGRRPKGTEKLSGSRVGWPPGHPSLDRTPPKEPPMPRMIFLNLPVTDLKRATAFYEAIGATRNPQFSDDTASCMVFSETIYAMLTTHAKFRQFTPKPIADAKTSNQALFCLSADTRSEVDDIVGRAEAAGGVADPSPKDEYSFMYGRSFEDPDGHMWGVNWMDLAAAPLQPDMANV
ncbi:MAG: lactoylglutathione lyase [Bradyrhizobiaceae bacterium]|nr:MAG: lactoylglutathione lyase [Bradyrhizobiaceae bacterium]